MTFALFDGLSKNYLINLSIIGRDARRIDLGSWLMAHGQEKWVRGGPDLGGHIFLGHEPGALSHEPRAMSLEPWAWSHEPLTINPYCLSLRTHCLVFAVASAFSFEAWFVLLETKLGKTWTTKRRAPGNDRDPFNKCLSASKRNSNSNT